MRFLFLFLALGLTALGQTGRPNVLLICVDDLRPELKCYGVDYIHSPHIDSLAKNGCHFSRHYVQSPTCGASRYALLTGTYGSSDNYALFAKAKQKEPIVSMPLYFRQQGYTTVSVGKVSHHPGGRGGPDWDDEAMPEMPGAWDRHLMPSGEWKHPRGAMHGLAHGEIRGKTDDMVVYQAEKGEDSIYPDGLITETTLEQLKELAKEADPSTSSGQAKPFFLAMGIIRPHLPFGCPAKYLEPYKDVKLPPIPHPEKPTGLSTWHASGEFRKYNQFGKDIYTDKAHQEEVRRHYAACVTYADAQIGRVLEQLDALKLRQNTIIVVWGDHGWHLGEHAIWGKHSLFEESLRSPLIINAPRLTSGGPTDTIAETVDIFPTICTLAGIQPPDGRDGKSLVLNAKFNIFAVIGLDDTAISYWNKATSIRTDRYRLILHKQKNGKEDYELYDHRNPDGESVNIADKEPEVVKQLKAALEKRRP